MRNKLSSDVKALKKSSSSGASSSDRTKVQDSASSKVKAKTKEVTPPVFDSSSKFSQGTSSIRVEKPKGLTDEEIKARWYSRNKDPKVAPNISYQVNIVSKERKIAENLATNQEKKKNVSDKKRYRRIITDSDESESDSFGVYSSNSNKKEEQRQLSNSSKKMVQIPASPPSVELKSVSGKRKKLKKPSPRESNQADSELGTGKPRKNFVCEKSVEPSYSQSDAGNSNGPAEPNQPASKYSNKDNSDSEPEIIYILDSDEEGQMIPMKVMKILKFLIEF